MRALFADICGVDAWPSVIYSLIHMNKYMCKTKKKGRGKV